MFDVVPGCRRLQYGPAGLVVWPAREADRAGVHHMTSRHAPFAWDVCVTHEDEVSFVRREARGHEFRIALCEAQPSSVVAAR